MVKTNGGLNEIATVITTKELRMINNDGTWLSGCLWEEERSVSAVVERWRQNSGEQRN